MQEVLLVKIGGNIVDDENKLSSFLQAFASLDHLKILVHGGGKMATRMAEQMGIPQQLVEGRRITDAETLKVVTMVYAGYINKNIVAQLQSLGCHAIGLTGADGNCIQALKRIHPSTDYGFAGDVDVINTGLLSLLLDKGYTPVISPITHDKNGQLLNTNADTIAQEVARSMSHNYEVSLVYSFEKEGVLLDINDPGSVIRKIDAEEYRQLKSNSRIFAGMIPKLDNAFRALESGVKKVIIGKAEDLHQLIRSEKGTTIRK